MSIDFEKLAAPFPVEDVEFRAMTDGMGSKGIWVRCAAYVTNRAIMDRLDDVCGPDNWRNSFRHAEDGTVLCGISIRHQSKGWITKWDGQGHMKANPGLSEADAAKGTLSGAMKRAAVQWGIGRYLYRIPEMYASRVSTDRKDGWNYGVLKQKGQADIRYWWLPPALPKDAVPEGGNTQPADTSTGEVKEDGPVAQSAQLPESAQQQDRSREPDPTTAEGRVSLINTLTDMVAADTQTPCMSAEELRWAKAILLDGMRADFGQMARGLAKLREKYPELTAPKERAA